MHHTYPQREFRFFSVGGLGAVHLFLFNGVAFGKRAPSKSSGFCLTHTTLPSLILANEIQRILWHCIKTNQLNFEII